MSKKYKVLRKVSTQEIKKDMIQHELKFKLAISIEKIPTMSCEDKAWAAEQRAPFSLSAHMYFCNMELLDALKQRKPSITVKRRHFTTQYVPTTQYEDHKFYWDEFWKEV